MIAGTIEAGREHYIPLPGVVEDVSARDRGASALDQWASSLVPGLKERFLCLLD